MIALFFSCDIVVVQDIQEVSQYIQLKFRLSLNWKDARVFFYNIKTEEVLNSLSLEEKLSLWTPTIVFWNTEKQLKSVNDIESFASIKRVEQGTIIDRTVNEDIEVFSGEDNEITFSRVYSIKFDCEYQMAWYPFDIQNCSIEMVFDGVLDNYADLRVGSLKFSGERELTQYFVREYKIHQETIQDMTAVVVSLTLGRRLLGTFLTVFFPTILLNLIGFATNFFKEFFFEVGVINTFLRYVRHIKTTNILKLYSLVLYGTAYSYKHRNYKNPDLVYSSDIV